MSSLPNLRVLLSSLLPPLPKPLLNPSPATPNPLQSKQKSLFLTLHCLFPNEFLPALDLLDRRLVIGLILGGELDHETRDEHSERTAQPPTVAKQMGDVPPPVTPNIPKLNGEQSPIFHVRPSNQTRERFSSKRNEDSTSQGSYYEVRLQAWNCSCAAFAFAAFSGEWDSAGTFREARTRVFHGIDVDASSPMQSKHGRNEWHIGGVVLGKGVPVCKHLLACVLAERVEGLSAFVEKRVVGREELAGWAAGWGG